MKCTHNTQLQDNLIICSCILSINFLFYSYMKDNSISTVYRYNYYAVGAGWTDRFGGLQASPLHQDQPWMPNVFRAENTCSSVSLFSVSSLLSLYIFSIYLKQNYMEWIKHGKANKCWLIKNYGLLFYSSIFVYSRDLFPLSFFFFFLRNKVIFHSKCLPVCLFLAVANEATISTPL